MSVASWWRPASEILSAGRASTTRTQAPRLMRWRAGRLYLADIGLPAALYAQLGIDVGPLFAPGRILTLDPDR